jgi:hypothetical protein
MSSSESEVQVKTTSKKDKNSKKAAAAVPEKLQDYQIKPAKGGPSMDTSTWPLLLKVCSQTLKIR